jgi:lysophospholipase L1-like esterase
VIVAGLGPLLLAELILRVGGIAPTGHFEFLLPAPGAGLHPPNTTTEHDWGPVPFTVTTNAMGFRDTGLELRSGETRRRIVAVGDSVTDGFFVEDDASYPYRLQTLIAREFPGEYEVVNGARGGASIDKELAILRQVVLPLEPEIVIVMFVTNDPAEIVEKDLDELLALEIDVHEQSRGAHRRAALWLVTRTGVGEALLRLYLRLRTGGRNRERGIPEEETDRADADEDPRYLVQGATDFRRNAEIFRSRNPRADGLVLTDGFTKEVERLLDRYLIVLDVFVETCRANGIRPVFVYFPAYSQVYDPGEPRTIQQLLEANCRRLGIDFLDLTPALRKAGRKRILYLAPIDFHPNPNGNDAIAQGIYTFLTDRGLLGRP